MKKIIIDMWYDDDPKTADKIDISFCDLDGIYRGNIWKNGKPIGDYSASDSLELEKAFPQLSFNWS